MISLLEALILQIQLLFYGGLIIMLSMWIRGDKERWQGIVAEDSVWCEPYFLASMIYIWFVGGSLFRYYYQIPIYGFLPIRIDVNPYIIWLGHLGIVIIYLLCWYYYKKRNKIL